MERAKAEFWARGIEALIPVPGQSHDTALTDLVITKGSSENMRFYGRTSEIVRERWGTKIHCAVNCRAVSPVKLRQAFTKMHKLQLRQMHNADLKAAGIVLDAEVSDDGIVDLRCVVTDPIAMTKVSQRTYTGCLVSFDGDDIADVSLVDSPAGFLEKSSAVICKIYDGGRTVDKDWKLAKKMSKGNGLSRAQNYAALKKVQKAYAPALPASARAVLAEQERINTLAQTGKADQLVLKAVQDRNNAAYGIELVKAIRSNPHARLGSPRYQVR